MSVRAAIVERASRPLHSIGNGRDARSTILWRHWRELCVRIGERRAGSAGEAAAAEYCLRQFAALGLANVHSEPFPCVTLRRAAVDLFLGGGKKFQRVAARALTGAPSTPGRKLIESDLVWIEMPEQAERKLTRALQGKVVALFGPLPTNLALHRRLVACRPLAVIHVDDRLPFDWVKDDGTYPSWVRQYGMPPTITIPYRIAWEIRRQGKTRARIRVAVDSGPGESQNVTAEIPGRRPDLPLVLFGSHHDTQCNNVGADDNASGVVALLELARRLSRRPPLRTVRFVSFGTEEQLSVGSAVYARKHRRAMDQIGVVLNIDSASSVLGHQTLWRSGTAAFGKWLMRGLAQAGLDAQEDAKPNPFADHFPFSVFGVPAVTFYRGNMNSGMRWQHHSAHDNLENVSVAELERVITAVAAVGSTLANSARWPFPRGLAKDQRGPTLKLARDLYDLGV